MLPRPQRKNEVVLICRYTLEQRWFLLPSDQIRALAGYCLGLALKGTQFEVSTVLVAPDRVLIVGTDVDCERSVMQGRFISTFARAINRSIERCGAPVFGPPDGDGATPILDATEAIRAMAEVLAAPAELALVERHQDWPGFRIGPEDWGKTLEYERPTGFFRESMPEKIEVKPVPPRGLEVMGEGAVREMVRQQTNSRQLGARMAREAEGREVLGKKALRKVSCGAYVEDPPERVAWRSYRTSSQPLADRAKIWWRNFAAAHALARQRMVDEEELAFTFPEGTYWWRIWSNVDHIPPRDRQPFDPP